MHRAVLTCPYYRATTPPPLVRNSNKTKNSPPQQPNLKLMTVTMLTIKKTPFPVKAASNSNSNNKKANHNSKNKSSSPE